jgi:hypothetical protein
VATSMAPVAFSHPQGQPRDTATPRSLWNAAKAPKFKNSLRGSSAPGAVSQLSIGRFGPDFEPPVPWGQLEVFLPLPAQTCDPPSAPVLPLTPLVDVVGRMSLAGCHVAGCHMAGCHWAGCHWLKGRVVLAKEYIYYIVKKTWHSTAGHRRPDATGVEKR